MPISGAAVSLAFLLCGASGPVTQGQATHAFNSFQPLTTGQWARRARLRGPEIPSTQCASIYLHSCGWPLFQL
eukprot:scaffold313494_cov33-Tisochrysis_lutea.AAC.2